MPIILEESADEASLPQAVVWIACAYHDTQQLAAWAIGANDKTWIEDATGLSEQWVGYVPDDDEKRAAGRLGLMWADDPPADGDVQHMLYTLDCPRPSCSYHAEMTDTTAARLTDVLREMVASGRDHYVIQDVDAFLRDPRPTLRLLRRTPG